VRIFGNDTVITPNLNDTNRGFEFADAQHEEEVDIMT
jgi:hypothetical protein